MPEEDGISTTMSPNTLITGIPGRTYDDIMKLNFGDYVQAYNVQGGKTNNTNARTVGAIALYPSGNQQGGWYFLSLLTGNRIHRYQWKTLPIGEDVIKRVHEIAIDQGQGLVAANFKYEWQPGTNFEDNHIEEHDNDNIDEIIYEETIQNQGARPPLLEMGEANTIEIYDNNETIHEEENEIDLEV